MSKSSQRTVGSRLKKLRLEHVMTQAELSNISGIPLPTIKDIERGATKIPHAKTIRSLAKALGVNPTDLVPK